MITELERFIMTVDSGSITKASKVLYLTQPTLSLSILRLEEEIKLKLFKRIGRRLVLTEEGKTVYQVGMQITKLWKNIKNSKNKNFNNPYYIGIYDNAALKLSKYFKKNFSKDGLKFEITIDTSYPLMQGIKNGLFDICVCSIGKDTIDNGIKLIKQFSEELVPVSSVIWRKPISKIPFILYKKESSTREYIDNTFFKNGVNPTVIVESTSTIFMKELALGGCGIALLPRNVIQREIENKKLFINKFPFRLKREIGVFLNKDSQIKEKDEVIREIIESLQ